MQTHIESTLEKDSKEYDFPDVPLQLAQTNSMSRKEKDKLKKKQEKLDHALDSLSIDQTEFFNLLRNGDKGEIRVFLDQVLMNRITALSSGGDQLEKPKKEVARRGSKKGKQRPHTPPDRHALHEAYYFLIKAYVEDKNDSDGGEK